MVEQESQQLKINPGDYDFIWKVDNFSYLQNSYWLGDEYLKREFLITNKGNEWKTYLSKRERDRLRDAGVKLVEKSLREFKEEVTSRTAYVREKFKEMDEIDFSKLSNRALKSSFLEAVRCVHKIISVFFFTEFFCYDKIQEKIEKLGVNKKDYLTSSPLGNIVSLEEYKRYKLAQNPTKKAIRTHLKKFDFIPYKEGKPRWTEKSLLKNIKSLKDVDKKIRKIEKNHREIIKSRKHNKLTDGVREIQEVKFFIRIFFNKVFFPNNIIDKHLREVSKRTKIERKTLHNFNYKEISRLLDGRKVRVKNRTNYVMGKFNGWKEILGKNALKIIDKFEKSISTEIVELKGQIGNTGYYKGKVKIIPFDVKIDLTEKIKEMSKGDVLVSGSTGPEMIRACHKAGAIITEEGGICSHAAIVSRELNIPCIIGTKIATKVLKDGDLVEVNAEQGIVKVLKQRQR